MIALLVTHGCFNYRRREHALQGRSRRHESLSTSLFTPLALGHQLRVYSRTRVAGPLAPRSWAYPTTTLPTSGNAISTVIPDPRWRARALRWILMHIDQPGLIPHAVLRPDDEGQGDPDGSAIPTLREMCVQTLISAALGAESQQPVIYGSFFDPDLPAHIRRFIVRYAATHCPLPWPALEELWGIAYGEQGADGEIILVGKDAGGSKISGSAIKSILTPPETDSDPQPGDATEELSWDAEEYTPPPLTTLISIAHPLSKHISLFPPTITHLALIAMPLDPDITPRVLLTRLSGGLRLLEALDLSCNSWLGENHNFDVRRLLLTRPATSHGRGGCS